MQLKDHLQGRPIGLMGPSHDIKDLELEFSDNLYPKCFYNTVYSILIYLILLASSGSTRSNGGGLILKSVHQDDLPALAEHTV